MERPRVILIAGTPGNNVKVQAQIHYLSQLVQSLERKVYEIEITPETTREDLDETLIPMLRENIVVILHNIDNMVKTVPVFMHAISDADNAPVKNALIFCTMMLNKDVIKSQKCKGQAYCEDAIRKYCPILKIIQKGQKFRHLIQAWESDSLQMNQLDPILSRITTFTICV